MPLNSCLFAVQLASLEGRPQLDRRLQALVQWYRGLGTPSVSVRHVEKARLTIGMIRFDGSQPDLRLPQAWGNELPHALGSAQAVLAAGQATLRDLPAPIAIAASDERHGRLVTSAGGVATLFTASSRDAIAWSSHAVAAAWLALGRVEVDPCAMLELIACDYVGGGDAIVRGVRELPPASSVAVCADGARTECFWPAPERWRLVAESSAATELEQALRSSLARALAGARTPVLGLTDGLDSKVIAVVLRALGSPVSCFTFAPAPGDLDVIGARAVAKRLGFPHRDALLYRWPDADGLDRLHAEVRWHEAGAPAWFGGVPWPPHVSHWVTGVGAETGRAYYYEWIDPPLRREPSSLTLERTLIEPFAARLAGVESQRMSDLRSRWRSWIDEARAAGLDGWRLLDFVYAEQRVRRWGRGLAPRLSASLVPGFAAVEVLSGLCSLSLEDRLHDGFERRLLERAAPELAPGPSARRRRGARLPVSPQLAKLLALNRVRATRRALGLRRLEWRPAGGPRWFELAPWSELPSYTAWLADEVLTAPLLAEAGGDSWRRELREGFLRGTAGAARATLLAASAVALQTALRELPGERDSEPGPLSRTGSARELDSR
jgi:hypothetical protein